MGGVVEAPDLPPARDVDELGYRGVVGGVEREGLAAAGISERLADDPAVGEDRDHPPRMPAHDAVQRSPDAGREGSRR